MNPTELFARLRTLVLRAGLAVGGVYLVIELWRWLIRPGGWYPAKMEDSALASLRGYLWPDSLGEIWIVERIDAWIDVDRCFEIEKCFQ